MRKGGVLFVPASFKEGNIDWCPTLHSFFDQEIGLTAGVIRYTLLT